MIESVPRLRTPSSEDLVEVNSSSKSSNKGLGVEGPLASILDSLGKNSAFIIMSSANRKLMR
jgi:hypothetical protein